MYCTVLYYTVLCYNVLQCTVIHMDRTVEHCIADARGSFGQVLEAGESWAEDYSLEHVHCGEITLVEELKRRLV